MSFIAEVEGHLAGFVLARLEYQGFPITGVAVIHTIAVEPGHQGQGIGSLLVDGYRVIVRLRGFKLCVRLFLKMTRSSRNYLSILASALVLLSISIRPVKARLRVISR